MKMRWKLCDRAGVAVIGLALAFAAFAIPSSLCAQTVERQNHPLIVPSYPVRFGDRSLESTIRTDERYGHDGLFQGPRGWVYWNYLENPRPIQNSNLWPDMRSTYFIGRFAMPAGSSMTLRGTFPYARFFQFALYRFERNTFVAFGESLRGPDIEPDLGSTNPFRVGANRLEEDRDFTIHLLAEDPPKDRAQRAKNTLYIGRKGNDIEAVIRIYLADQNKDGTGWGPPTSPFAKHGLPTYEATLADGTQLSSEQVVEQFAKPIVGETQKPMTVDQWVQLVQAKDNDPQMTPETTPARHPPRWEKFWTIAYSVVGIFKSAEARAKIRYAGAMEGGGEGPYLVTYLSRQYGPVYVMQGKMPTFPDTYAGKDGKGAATMPAAQTQYWSLVSCESVPSGQVVDGLSDFQIPLDKDRNYTIVVSRPEDRPKNATRENGVAWIKWSPRGEGLEDPRNRPDFGMLILRIMGNAPSWKQRPDNILTPGTAEEVMGPYFPKGRYTTKEAFESQAAKATMITGQGKTMTLTMQTLPNARGYQYCELVFNYGTAGNDIYSTSPLAQADLDWWNNLDLKALAKEFGAESVYKNGPQWWSMDEVGVLASEPVAVAGANMVFGAHLPAGTLKIPNYTVFNPAKTQNLLWKAGKPVYQLVDPDGHVYVLQGQKIPKDSIASLGKRLKKMPEGWTFRVKVLDEDLVMKLSPQKPIPSVQDEFNQIYIRIPE
ncbi:hypothetical protein Pan258_46910 [Symmachiella dynata]|uniref:hypothetical protein n=1 Tax=Symmachiella dynata TaxID=2527995 RepID=UPI00118A5600|nr:hypothetical protein [Symmachiella dynata]QDT50612.1 hypothetical protein Pan258_46910 [Symmachiella dynata]